MITRDPVHEDERRRPLARRRPQPHARGPVARRILEHQEARRGLGGRRDLPTIHLAAPATAPAVLISARNERTRPLDGRLFWRYPGVAHFNVTDARRSRNYPGPPDHTIVRLVAPPTPLDHLELRLETRTASDLEDLIEVRVLDGGS